MLCKKIGIEDELIKNELIKNVVAKVSEPRFYKEGFLVGDYEKKNRTGSISGIL